MAANRCVPFILAHNRAERWQEGGHAVGIKPPHDPHMGFGAWQLLNSESVGFRRERRDSAPAEVEPGGCAKVMKAERRPPGWRGGLQRLWKGLVLCCCGELEDLHTEALVVVPVSELSSRFLDLGALFLPHKQELLLSLGLLLVFPAREGRPYSSR